MFLTKIELTVNLISKEEVWEEESTERVKKRGSRYYGFCINSKFSGTTISCLEKDLDVVKIAHKSEELLILYVKTLDYEKGIEKLKNSKYNFQY